MKTPTRFFQRKNDTEPKVEETPFVLPVKKILLSIVALVFFLTPATILGIQANKEASQWRANWDVVTYARQNPDIVRQVRNKHNFMNQTVHDEIMQRQIATESATPSSTPTATPESKKELLLK